MGTVFSASSLAAARALAAPPAPPDLLELRVDHFAPEPAALETLAALAARSARPLIVTVRHFDQGGHGRLEAPDRRRLYERFLPPAHYVDLELSAMSELEDIARQARLKSGGLIASHHDFRGGLSPERLHDLAGRAVDAGAVILKVAMPVEEPRALAVLLEFLATETRLPLALMGMGRLGRISRLAAAAVGSRLNYGYLGESAQIPGQWPAALLSARLQELGQNAAPAQEPIDPDGAGRRNSGD